MKQKEHIAELEAEIEQLQKCCTQRGARMQKLRKWIAGAVYPLSPEEAFTDIEGWFDEDGVPK